MARRARSTGRGDGAGNTIAKFRWAGMRDVSAGIIDGRDRLAEDHARSDDAQLQRSGTAVCRGIWTGKECNLRTLRGSEPDQTEAINDPISGGCAAERDAY